MYFDTHAHYDSGAFNADWKEGCCVLYALRIDFNTL